MSIFRDATWAESALQVQAVGAAYRDLPLWRRMTLRVLAPDLAAETQRCSRTPVLTVDVPRESAALRLARSGGFFGDPGMRR